MKKRNKGITLIALVITIIILLILVGITIVQLTGSGLFGKTEISKQKTRYESAKEVINLKLMEIQVDCIQNNDHFTIERIAESIGKEIERKITIEKYYNGGETASIKDGVIENLIDLKGIVVSVNEYSEYKFLIGKKLKIEKVTMNEITEGISVDDFKDINEFEKELLGKTTKIDSESDSKIKTYLYKSGNECEEITNGWDIGYVGGTDSTMGRATKNENTNIISLETYGTWCAYACYTHEKINFHGYSKLFVELDDITQANTGYDKLEIKIGESVTEFIREQTLEFEHPEIYEIDITDIKDTTFIFIIANNGASTKVKNIWLEK